MPRQSHPWFRASKQRWYVSMHGKQVALPVTDPKDQQAAYAAWQALLKSAPGQPEIDRKLRPNPTCAEVVRDFLADVEGRVKPHTLKVYRWFLTYFAEKLGAVPLNGVTAPMIEESSRKPEWCASSRNDYIGSVMTCLRWGGVNLTRRVRKPPKASRGAKALVSEETYRECVYRASGDWALVIAFLWHTGARPSEAARSRVEDVDWDNRLIRLSEHKTDRHGGDRLIYLNAEAFEIVSWQRRRYGRGLLFRGRAGAFMLPRAFGVVLTRLSKLVGKKVTAYGLRHSFATRALASGQSDTIVAALLGHRGTGMIHKNYNHVAEMGRQLRDVVDRLGKAG